MEEDYYHSFFAMCISLVLQTPGGIRYKFSIPCMNPTIDPDPPMALAHLNNTLATSVVDLEIAITIFP